MVSQFNQISNLSALSFDGHQLTPLAVPLKLPVGTLMAESKTFQNSFGVPISIM
jgi:hypothetical protein